MELKIPIPVPPELSQKKKEVLKRLRAFSKRGETKKLIEGGLEDFQENWRHNPSRFGFSFKDKDKWQVMGKISVFPTDFPTGIKLHLNLPEIDSLDEPGIEMIQDVARNLMLAILAPPWCREAKRIIPHSLSPEEALRRLWGFSGELKNRFPNISGCDERWENKVSQFKLTFWTRRWIVRRMGRKVSGMVCVYCDGVHLLFDPSEFVKADEGFRRAALLVEETVRTLLK